MIYFHRTSLTAVGGSISTVTLTIPGGLCQQVLIRANTSTTVFNANVEDTNGLRVLDYGYHEGEINDYDINLPMAGAYTLRITNASPNDTFNVLVGVDER